MALARVSTPPRRCDVVVVGAGLSGLEMAAELLRAGVQDIVVLEAGPATRTNEPRPTAENGETTPATRNGETGLAARNSEAASTAQTNEPKPAPRNDQAGPAARNGETEPTAGNGEIRPATRDSEPGPTTGNGGAGPDLAADWNRPGRDPALWRPWSSDRLPHYGGDYGIRRKVGGRSLYWRGIVLPIEDWALGDPVWPAAVRRDLGQGWRGGAGLYQRVLRDLGDWSGRALEAPRSPNEQALLDLLTGAAALPVRPVPVARRYWAEGSRVCWEPYGPLGRWMDAGGRIGGEATPLVVPDCTVVEIDVASARVTGVGFRRTGTRERHWIDCGFVVLAAAAVENARLVAQAGPGGRSFPGLNDHLRQGFLVRTAAGGRPVPAGLAFLPATARQRSNVFVEARPADAAGFAVWDVWGIGEQERSDFGRVSFDATTGVPWSSRIAVGLSPRDEVTVEAQRRQLRQVWTGLRPLLSLGPEPPRFGGFLAGTPTYPQAYEQVLNAEPGRPIAYCAPLGSVDHEGGLTPLGDVLHESGEVSGISGLFVVGPGTFPRSGAANPSLTTLALARRTARTIAGGT